MRDRLLRSRLREVFLITLDNGDAFRGLLYALDRQSVILRQTETVNGTEIKPVDGEIVLPRHRIAYMQRP